jgi:hypothetical protein
MASPYKKYLKELVDYVISEGYVITFEKLGISEIYWVKTSLNTPKSIHIRGCKGYETKVYILLHELGHHELRKDWVRFTEILPIIANAEEKQLLGQRKFVRRKEYHIACLEEEYLAWFEGLGLAQRMGIPIQMNVWNRLKNWGLQSYINYYGVRK